MALFVHPLRSEFRFGIDLLYALSANSWRLRLYLTALQICHRQTQMYEDCTASQGESNCQGRLRKQENNRVTE